MSESKTIDAPDLPALMRFSAARRPADDRTLAQAETDHILTVLAAAQGNKSRAAAILGIDRKTLRAKLKSTLPAGRA